MSLRLFLHPGRTLVVGIARTLCRVNRDRDEPLQGQEPIVVFSLPRSVGEFEKSRAAVFSGRFFSTTTRFVDGVSHRFSVKYANFINTALGNCSCDYLIFRSIA